MRHIGLDLIGLGWIAAALVIGVLVATVVVWLMVRRPAAQLQAEPAAMLETLPAELCDHAGAVPVELIVTGELVARWCPACSSQLDVAGFDSSH